MQLREMVTISSVSWTLCIWSMTIIPFILGRQLHRKYWQDACWHFPSTFTNFRIEPYLNSLLSWKQCNYFWLLRVYNPHCGRYFPQSDSVWKTIHWTSVAFLSSRTSMLVGRKSQSDCQFFQGPQWQMYPFQFLLFWTCTVKERFPRISTGFYIFINSNLKKIGITYLLTFCSDLSLSSVDIRLVPLG